MPRGKKKDINEELESIDEKIDSDEGKENAVVSGVAGRLDCVDKDDK